MTSIQDTAPPESERSRVAALALGDTQPSEDPGTNWIALAGLIAFFGWLLFFAGLAYFLIALGVIFMIFLHELGHFMTAKWTGMKPTDFFIGFGPTIVSWRRGEVTYGVKAIPAGAFVRIIGMNNLDPVAPHEADRAYMNKSYPRRMLVITAGSMMHFFQAIIIFVGLTTVFGISEDLGTVVSQTGSEVYDLDLVTQSAMDAREAEYSNWTTAELPPAAEGDGQSTAEILNIVEGEKILSVDGVDTSDWRDLIVAVRERPAQTVEFVILTTDSSTRTQTAQIGIAPFDETQGRIGLAPDISFEPYETQYPGVGTGLELFGSQMFGAVKAIPTFVSPATLLGLGESVATGTEPADEGEARPTSIVGAVGIAGRLAQIDWRMALYLLGVINVFVGLFNLVPLLPLDGGHAAIATYERVRSFGGKRHQMDVAKLMPVTYAVVGLLIFIGLTTIILDVRLLAS